jgi:hypothetical protein
MPPKRNNRKKPARRNNRKNQNNRRKQPYRAQNKRNTAKMIAPIAEGRKASFLNDSSHIKIVGASEDDGWQVFIPETFNQMYREQFLETLDKSPTSTGFTGNTLFSRFITQQLKIKFDNVKHIAEPAGFQVIYGWSKLPYITATQSEGVTSTNTNNVLIEHEPDDMIAKTLADMYNKMFPTTDPKMFKLFYNRRFQVGGYQVNTTRTPASQVRKDLNYRVKWTPNTKYHMRSATQGNGNDAMGNPVKPDTGSVTYAGPTGVTGYDSYWTPSGKKNGDLWTPFFAIRLTNPENFGVDKDGHADTNAYPILFQKNRHYFFDV